MDVIYLVSTNKSLELNVQLFYCTVHVYRPRNGYRLGKSWRGVWEHKLSEVTQYGWVKMGAVRKHKYHDLSLGGHGGRNQEGRRK